MQWTDAFAGRVGIVTAAAVGIGEAIASTLARGGARLTLVDLNESGIQELAGKLRATGADVLPLCVNAMVESEVENMVRRTLDHFGSLDTLVNAVGGWVAGGGRPSRSIAETPASAWSTGLELQVTPACLCSKASWPHLVASGRGRIVNIGSIVARSQFYYTSPAYVAGKAALHGLSRYLAAELGPEGVTVNTVAPGPVYTPRTRANLESGGAERVISGSALGRVGEAGDVAEVVAFLISDAARHITGATLDVNGGYLMVGG